MLKRNIMIAFKFLLICLSVTMTFCKLDKEKVVIAINCGGPEFTDSDGVEYIKDKYYDAGVRSDHGISYDISGTEDQDVYQTERWHSDTFTYSVPLKEAGKYVLILKFSEVYFQAANEKVFDVGLGRKTILKNLDIFATVGKSHAYDEYVEFELKNDKIYHNNGEVADAYDTQKKAIKIKFLKGPKDNPKINAIVILKGTIEDTEYAEKKRKLDEINRKRLHELKKNQLLVMKHHPDIEYNEDLLLNDENDSILTQENPTLVGMLFSLHGMYIVASFLLFLGINYALDLSEGSGSKRRKVHTQ